MDPAPSADADASNTTQQTPPDPVEALKRTLEHNSSHSQFEQLIAPIEKHLRWQIRKRNCFLFLQVLGFLAVIASGLWCCTPVYAHLRALGRMGLIKLAPYWSWSDYYDRECLVENSLRKSFDADQNSCAGCEDVATIQALKNVSLRNLVDNYVSQDLPVIVSDGALDWPLTNDGNFQIELISKEYVNDDSTFGICEWSSNLRPDDIELDEFFSLVNRLPDEKSWFAHWENCGKRSVKTGRRFFLRPYFATPAVDMSYNNWILLSKNYVALRFKQLKLRSRFAMLAQTQGANHIRLQPKEECESKCAVLQFSLFRGEILVFNPRKWKFQYKPMEELFNVAFVIQADID